MSEKLTPNAVGTQVTRILDEATAAAADVLDQADRQADRAGREELTGLRDSLEERIEAVRETRARLAELGDGTSARLRATASQLAEMPARLTLATQNGS